MRRIAHLSDLHFGTEDHAVAEGLLADLAERSPALVVVSGDVTQRAKVGEFMAARAWLARIPFAKLVVPGNHDVPFYDVFRRFARPLRRYRAWISDDLQPFHADGEIAVLGLTTARSLTWKGGRISHEQIEGIRAAMCPQPTAVFKVVVTHHQFIPPHGAKRDDLVGRAGLALAQLESCGVDLLLAGHLHIGYTGDAKAHHAAMRRSILVAQAGTAISRRRRGEPNAYNDIVIDGDALSIAVRAWDGARFAETTVSRFRRRDGEWSRII